MALTADIDGTNITPICQEITWRSRLNAPASGIVRYPAQLFSIVEGISELHIYESGGLVFSGPCWYSQADGGPDSAYAEVTGYDHSIHLLKRMCKTASGNLITPGDVLFNEYYGPYILAAFIDNVNSYDATLPNGNAMPLTVNSKAGGGVDMSGSPMNFPMTIEQMKTLLVNTGEVDIVVNPGIGGSTCDIYNGDYGTDLSGSVAYEYGTGAYNCQIATKTGDMEDTINALWYLLGPRKSPTRWAGSITPTAANAGGDGPGDIPGTPWPPSLVARFSASRNDYGYMQEIRIYDDEDDSQAIRPLYENLWAKEAWLRATPRQFASIRPERGITPNFGIGDIIHVAAGSQLHGGFAGAQRVYEVEWRTDFDGIIECTDILTSGDQEGS
jgi:hypothetical protein